MKLIILLIVFVCAISVVNCRVIGAPRILYRSTDEVKGKCGVFAFGEKEAIDCIMNVIDGNVAGTPGRGDKKVTIAEIDMAKSQYLYFYERAVIRLFGGPTSKIMNDCSQSKQGPITIESFFLNRKTCLPDQGSLCHLKEMCDRASVAMNKPVY